VGTVFAVGLLASGLASTSVGAYAGGEGMDARQYREKTQVVGAYDGGARLLEHDLRDPDVVRCRFVAPRQVARVGRGFAPCEQGTTEGGKDVCARPRLYIHRWFSISC